MAANRRFFSVMMRLLVTTVFYRDPVGRDAIRNLKESNSFQTVAVLKEILLILHATIVMRGLYHFNATANEQIGHKIST